jgi:hypothetical protein
MRVVQPVLRREQGAACPGPVNLPANLFVSSPDVWHLFVSGTIAIAFFINAQATKIKAACGAFLGGRSTICNGQ